jgi:DNA-binding SARP family transcriptional activator
MADKEQRDIATQANEQDALQQEIDEVTPEQQEWFRLAGFSRIEWQRLVYARWRHRQGLLTDYPQG